MNELAIILGLALLPAAGNFLGGVLAEVTRPSPKAVSLALHAAVGLIFAIIATELLPEASEVLSGWLIGGAFIVGGLLYIAADALASKLSSGGASGSKRMWLIYAAVMVDPGLPTQCSHRPLNWGHRSQETQYGLCPVKWAERAHSSACFCSHADTRTPIVIDWRPGGEGAVATLMDARFARTGCRT